MLLDAQYSKDRATDAVFVGLAEQVFLINNADVRNTCKRLQLIASGDDRVLQLTNELVEIRLDECLTRLLRRSLLPIMARELSNFLRKSQIEQLTALDMNHLPTKPIQNIE